MRCLDYFTLMPVLPEVHFCPVGIVILCSKDIFSYNSMLIYFRCNTAIEGKLASNVKWAMQVASEKGASSWLATLLIAKHGFALHKCAFQDALCLQYGWWPSHLPSHCICGQHFTVEHAPICTHGGFPSIRHNELRNMMAVFFTEVWHNVGIEPPLQPLTGKHLTLRSANRKDGAHLDISADNPWGRDRNHAFLT